MSQLRRQKRARRALALGLLAVFGLIAAPLLHARQHAREAEAEKELTRLVERLSLHGSDFDDVFSQAWALARGKPPAHTHGQGPRESHGSGTLEHFALALHAAPPPPAAPAPEPQPRLLAAAEPLLPHCQPRRGPVLAQGPPAVS